ncbi:MAG: hypothetical protein KJ052_20200 [Candidatus Hydrogenedentes bacterium]|nr:hypothetical protein [Candidatus Hydrogenedentota bacterium]
MSRHQTIAFLVSLFVLICAGCATSPLQEDGTAKLDLSPSVSSVTSPAHVQPQTVRDARNNGTRAQEVVGPYAVRRPEEHVRVRELDGTQYSVHGNSSGEDSALSLSQAWYAYKHFSYAEVMAWGNELLRTTSASRQQQAEAAILMGASAYMMERNAESDGWFKRAVSLDPETKPNPAFFTAEVRKRYEAARLSREWRNR